MNPLIPHLTCECLERLDIKENIKWPSVEEKYIQSEKSEIVIQVNGKKRGTISIKKGADEKFIVNNIKETKLIEKYLKDKEVFKIIYVKDKIINFIVK